jgi:hypothetical protein
MSDEQVDDTSIPFVDSGYFRNFLAGKEAHPGQVGFIDQFQVVAAEMHRRLARQQFEQLAAQRLLLESQEKAARSLNRATWVLSIATIFLAVATLLPVLEKL